ncbi:MAG: undecaprenyl-phosphate glucose phosphotransferase [Planctomycetes bacterium]|nr:undecaprenyl-phosphate glucose phosphotransferase [Planctomycetota bacterium]
MLRERGFLWRNLFATSDLTLSVSTFFACYWIRFVPPVTWINAPSHPQPPIETYFNLRVIPAIYVCFFLTNSFFRLYHPRRISNFLDEFLGILKSNCVALLLLSAFFFLDRSMSISRGIVLLFFVLNPAALFIYRLTVRAVLRSLRSRGFNLRHVLIVGIGRPAQALIHRFHRNPWTGIRVVGSLSLAADKVGREIHGVPVIGSAEELGSVLDDSEVDQVFIALPPEEHRTMRRLIAILADRMIPVRVVQDPLFESEHPVTTDFQGLRIVQVWEKNLDGWNAFAKRAIDIVGATFGLIILAPFLLVLAIAVRWSSCGPVFHVQERMGLDGRTFRMIKFRSMRPGAEDTKGFTKPDDNRCTPVGRFLRRTSLDELPQLFNVLVGDMSLVGPRPERPVYIDKFRKTIPRYMLRHKIKAGMTGWAQVNGWRGNSSLKKRIQYDLFYMHHWSIWFDLKILVMTLLRGWMHPNAY